MENKIQKVQASQTLPDLVFDKDKFRDVGYFQEIVNREPPQAWVKTHPMIKGYQYIPIDVVEYLLRSIFQAWEWTVVDYKILANSITVHGRLRVLHPVTAEWLTYDGLGAVDIQLKSGSAATDFNSIVHGAIQKNLPAAESYALKDAAEKLGKLFGGSINRADSKPFQSPYSRWTDGEQS